MVNCVGGSTGTIILYSSLRTAYIWLYDKIVHKIDTYLYPQPKGTAIYLAANSNLLEMSVCCTGMACNGCIINHAIYIPKCQVTYFTI